MPVPPEKNKKVSRACNTCRLKRKKCDGLEPCVFCTDNGNECSYSREPKRRGPPSGYLRYTETRVALLETLLGLYIQTAGHQTTQTFHEAARGLKTESTAHTTQDVWDAYKQNWIDCDASRVVLELTAVFAPFTPPDNQATASRALLPPPQSAEHPQPLPVMQHPPPPPPPRPPRSPSPFAPTPVALYTNESFERSVIPNDLEQPRYQHEPERSVVPNLHSTIHEQQQYEDEHVPDMDFNMDTELSMPMPMPIFLPSPPADTAPPSSSSASVYPGAYWRTAALASPSPHFDSLPLPPGVTEFMTSASSFASAPPAGGADLPPSHVCAALLETYRTAVHPALPILSPAQCAAPAALEGSPMLLLALCAYTARLAPPAVPTRVAADLWYESASALLSASLRRAVVHSDTVQTLLFLALRDHGRARDALAWRGVGAAVRVAIELGIDACENDTNTTNESSTGEPRESEAWKRGLWGVASMLDLFLSIQLGRTPATAEALRPLAPDASCSGAGMLPSPAPSTSSGAPTAPSTSITAATTTPEDDELATHMRALVRIVARVHFCVALGYAGGSSSSTGSILRAELAAWHRALPGRFRVALGGERVPRPVLEAHMLYQVAVGMLARAATSSNPGANAGAGTPSSIGTGTSDAEADDAASTFNVLLDKYRPSLPLAGPPVVWLVFAAARAGLQRAGAGKGGGGVGTARALQTQLYLLNCREALAAMGGTWELARRCARTLERRMEGEASRPQSGKRKRVEGGEGADRDEGGESGAKRPREEEAWAEQFDFGAGWAEIDELGAAVQGGAAWTGDAGLWDTGSGAWDESLWGRTVFGAGQAFTSGGPGGFGLGLGLFDASSGG